MVSYFKKKARSRRYPTETITDADYADNLALLAYTPAKVESPTVLPTAISWRH